MIEVDITCPRCGYKGKPDSSLRCPRCYELLAASCKGSCRKCRIEKTKGQCR